MSKEKNTAEPVSADHLDYTLDAETILQHYNADDKSSQSSASAQLAASSPLTEGDRNSDIVPVLHNAKIYQEEEVLVAPRSYKTPEEEDGLAVSQNLRKLLWALDLIRLGRHPALAEGREHIDFALDSSELDLLRQLVLEPCEWEEVCALGIDTGLGPDVLELLRDWAPKRLRWEYDSRRALLTIRMPSAVHQRVARAIADLFVERFKAALERSGRGGEIVPSDGIEQIFREPEAVFEPVAPLPQRVLPQRSGSRRGQGREHSDETAQQRHSAAGSAAETNADVGPEIEVGGDVGAASGVGGVSRGNSPNACDEKVYSPDVSLSYIPPGGEEEVYPGLICEIGYSAPMDDEKAKRYIRYSSGHVRYVMAFNIRYDVGRRRRDITLHAHQLATTVDTWFPEKCLDAYDVHAQAEAARQDGTGETDIGLRLSHLHDSLEETEVPITLPLRKLIDIVEQAHKAQARNDALKSRSRVLLPPKSLSGKRARLPSPPEGGHDEASLLRDPDSSYVDRSSSKRRKTDTSGT